MSSRLRTSQAVVACRSLLMVVACAGLVTSGAVAGLVGPGPAAATTGAPGAPPGAAPGWYAATQPPHVFSEAPAVTCVSGGADCVAIGAGTTCTKMIGVICVAERGFNVAEYSRDGGVSWQAAPVPSAGGGEFIELASVSCARADQARTDCAVWAMLTQEPGTTPTEQAAYFSTNGGATWGVASPPAPVAQNAWQAPVVSCYEVHLAVDCAGAPDSLGTEYSTNGGADWAPSSYRQSPSFGALGAQDLSCAVSGAQMDCVAVGFVFDTATGTPADTVWYSTDGGMKWAPGALEQRVGELNTVSCVTAKGQVRCAALGTETTNGITANVAVYSGDGGKSWGTSVFPRGTELPSPWGNVSCAAAGPQVDCAASGSTLLFSADGGATWLPASDPNGAWGDIACLPSSPGPSCYVVGARAAYSHDGGAKWSASKVAKGFEVQDSMLRDNITCASASVCAVAGLGELFTTQAPHPAG